MLIAPLPTALHLSRGYGIEDDGHHNQGHTEKEYHGVALRRTNIVDDDTQHQGDAHTQGEGYRHTRNGDGCREQDITQVKNSTTNERTCIVA